MQPAPDVSCDVLVIGGGINGVGIARDAAGRGLSVVLCEKDDLASHTSSASSKLIHGGLRYLEHYQFGLVRKSLVERERLLRAAPHLVAPLRFAVPHDASQRPAWFIRCGLFLYDHLARRRILPGSGMVRLEGSELGAPLRPAFHRAFVYSDAQVDDARLVVLCAVDAAERGARVLTRARCVRARPEQGRWRAAVQLEDGRQLGVSARAVVNAAGPFAARVAGEVLGRAAVPPLRLVQGSHVVVRRLYEHGSAYLFQNPDGRVIFAIPFLADYTLIGTTDVEFTGDADRVGISAEEIAYLCDTANRYFRRAIGPADVLWSYSGVRPLLGDGSASASDLSRDYRLDAEASPAPLLHVWGGKLTTFRKLSEQAVDRLLGLLGARAGRWTASAPLPGGDVEKPGDAVRGYAFDGWLDGVRARLPWLPPALALRYARAYGTRLERVVGAARRVDELGELVAPGLHEAELRYLVREEFARSAEDVLWRRTKLGLRCGPEDARRVQAWLDRELRPERVVEPAV